LDTTIQMGSTIPDQHQEKYVEGEVAIMHIIERNDEVRWGMGCKYCYISELLDSPAGMPWTLMNYHLGEEDIYMRSLQYFRSTGEDIEEMQQWIEGVVEICRI
jgi:hypothetical protein